MMTNIILTISDPDGGIWSVELGHELYALLVAASQRSAAPSGVAEMRVRLRDRSSPATVAASELERSLLQRMDAGEGTGIDEIASEALRLLAIVREQMAIDSASAAAIERLIARARPTGLDWSRGEVSAPTRWPRWHVRGVISYSLTRAAPDNTAVVDMMISSPDWHAAETAAVERVRVALELDDDTPFVYNWASGPNVTPAGDDEPGDPGR
jgi:hypothetical protein